MKFYSSTYFDSVSEKILSDALSDSPLEIPFFNNLFCLRESVTWCSWLSFYVRFSLSNNSYPIYFNFFKKSDQHLQKRSRSFHWSQKQSYSYLSSVKALKFLNEWLTDTSSIEEWLCFFLQESTSYSSLIPSVVSRFLKQSLFHHFRVPSIVSLTNNLHSQWRYFSWYFYFFWKIKFTYRVHRLSLTSWRRSIRLFFILNEMLIVPMRRRSISYTKDKNIRIHLWVKSRRGHEIMIIFSKILILILVTFCSFSENDFQL